MIPGSRWGGCPCCVMLRHGSLLRPCTPGRPRRSDATFLPPRDVSTCGWREGRPGTTRTGRDGTGEWRRPGSQRYAVLSSPRSTAVLRVRAYVTLVPTTLAHHGGEGDFVGLFNRCGWCRLHRFARCVVLRVPVRGVHVGGVPDREMDWNDLVSWDPSYSHRPGLVLVVERRS